MQLEELKNETNQTENLVQETKTTEEKQKVPFKRKIFIFFKETIELLVVTLILLIIIRQGFIEDILTVLVDQSFWDSPPVSQPSLPQSAYQQGCYWLSKKKHQPQNR